MLLHNMDGNMDELEPEESFLHQSRAILYANTTLWDILVDSSNVFEDDHDSSMMLQEKRVASMIGNMEELLKAFAVFIGEICSNDGHSETTKESCSDAQNFEDTETLKGKVQLTDQLASAIQFKNRNLLIKNSMRIDLEFDKCEKSVSSTFSKFTINDNNGTYLSTYEENDLKPSDYQRNLNKIPSLSIKPEEQKSIAEELELWNCKETDENLSSMSDDVPLYSDELPFETDYNINDSMISSHTSKLSRKRKRKAGRPRGSKMKSADSTTGRFRRLGYYPDYCVSEEVYKDTIEKGSPYSCPLCQKMYKERRSLEKHFAGTVSNKCPGVPVEKPTYRLENGRYYCTQPGCEHEIATHGAKSMGVIWTHHQSEHLSKDANLPFSCDQCSKSFPLHSILASHIASTHDLKKCSQICDVCGKTIAGSKNKIKQHMLVHTGEKIKCTECDITFSRPGSLRRHMQHQHNSSPQTHFCDVCGKGWNTRSALNEHRESHHKELEENSQDLGQPVIQNYSQVNGKIS